MDRLRDLALKLSGIAIVVVAWEIVGRSLGEFLLAAPSIVLPLLIDMIARGDILVELAGSLRQMLIGFGLACLVGMPLGTLMGRVAWIDAFVHPWVGMIVVTSIAALVPIFMLLFGTGLAMRIAIVFVGSVGYIVMTAYHGARGIDVRYVNAARSFSVGGIALYRKVLLPALFPYLITGARLGLVHAIRAMVVAEMFVITGYGGLIFQTGLDLSVAPLLAYLILLMVVSLAGNALLAGAGERIAPWYTARQGMRGGQP
ncbi:ABC transporter permease [Acuticoccus sp.]|uniref:ABC transporter permease n=1 Tax=Acuticoccus sp. TaxID=1904378 RepID=UPI003B5269CD